ncbi:histidine biosynthesis bifunctional protein hisB [Candidatus Blochmanniella vafra str. BVAF]|uniref:Histidine biosynthesis bifunctional protein HisB n=1 Tax=Blochmanniella vafra (strain BVAF) TaxID=859654 RepID=E8Q728_BLOVB|nr:bifunctional histidinol-phosphatase/imidazoleglycerol-phosphate dehydratase HisB [Candidatus Blochmannia vafer]ADV33852.1 histidine biosynthesis bifunctional protein hisB [Candidatus Blochmannia vafer str. BVAF]
MNDNKILFIDRDGTLIHEPENNFQIDSLEKLSLEPYVIPVLTTLKNIGFKFIIVTNQNGLGSLTFPYNKFNKPHQTMIQIFKSQGIIFDQILICPHLPEAQCNCRKPNIGLVSKWLKNKLLNKFNSYVIGDRDTDMQLATNMGIQGIQYHQKNFNWIQVQNHITQNSYRSAHIQRITNETNVDIKIWLDQYKKNYINTGINFFNHMLEQIAIHAKIRIHIIVQGDLHIDDHHTIEDTASVLGEAIKKSLGEKKGIGRFGFTLPMDECTAHCILDLSGRAYLDYQAQYDFQKIGDLSSNMIEHFFRSLSLKMECTLHLKAHGKNDHHKAESLFKAFGQTLRQAIHIYDNHVLSSKGTLI